MLLCVLVTLCFTLLSLPFKLGLWPTCVAGAHYPHRHSERLISHLGSDIVDPEDVPYILRFSLIQDMKALRQQPSASRRAAESADADMAAVEALIIQSTGKRGSAENSEGEEHGHFSKT